MRRSRLAGLVIAVLAVSIAFVSCAKPKYPDGLYAEVRTNKGLIVLQLAFDKTPMTAANFVGLAEGTIDNAAFPPGRPYFDGTKWHRVVAGHVIQCGIPQGEKTGADGGPGYEFPNEIVLPDLNHGRAGMVNMANGGPHTNGSQWCITLGDRSYLDGDYTVFGRVIQGMDVVFAIAQGDEVKSVKIVRVGAAANKFRPTTESFQKMVEAAKINVKQAEAKKSAAEKKTIRTKWPQAKTLESGVKYVVVKEGEGAPASPGTKLRVSYAGSDLNGPAFFSTADAGKPYFGTKPEPFVFEVGKATVNRGFDAAVAQMKKGEKRTLIIPAPQGYGTAGYYDREKPGQKRFHISPNTTLVYEVEVLDIIR